MRASMVVVTTAFAGWASAVVAYAGCGYVSEILCPGCDGHIVTSGCSCGPIDQACKCRRNDGTVQQEIMTMCEVGPFDYLFDEDGPTIEASDPIPCGQNLKCLAVNGTPINCGNYSQFGYCVSQPPPAGGCSWRVFGSPWTETAFIQTGDPCSIPH